MNRRRLILASSSPRRQSLLREAGYEFLVQPADVDEDELTRQSNLPPKEVPAFLARAKAQKIATRFPDDVILAADTIVTVDNHVMSKPTDADDARRILSILSGTTNLVITGVVILHGSTTLSDTVVSAVEMKNLSPPEIDAYIATGLWQGKAGGYGIQDSDPFISKMTGCLTNIVGLPMTTTARLLREAGIQPSKN